MEDNITDLIQRKIWSVDQLTLQAKALATKAKLLPSDEKKNIPVYSGEWSEDSIQKFFEKFKDSIVDPIRHRNRELLENIGIKVKGISEEVFDDSIGIEEVVRLLRSIKEFNETIFRILVGKEFLSAWLREALTKTKENLQEILDAKMAFKIIVDSSVNEGLRDELLQRSITDRRFVTSAEDILSKIRFIIEYGISTEYKENFDTFKSNLENVYEKLESLQTKYRIPKDEIIKLVNGRPLHDVDEVLKNKLEECSEKERRLLDEWKMYSQTLKSIGCEVPELPQGLHELEEEVRKLKTKCLDALGEEGLNILAFLKGERDFPDKISKDDIKKTLEILRPIFVKFLREEVLNA
jgi:hypothetical protein